MKREYCEIELETIAEYREKLKNIFPVLSSKCYLWHCTKVKYLASILKQGILPVNGERASYPQSKNSLGFHLESVCLFDFRTLPEEDIYLSAGDWACFLHDGGNLPVLIPIKVESLDSSKLMLPGNIDFSKVILEGGMDPRFLTHFWAVEALHHGIIYPDNFGEEVFLVRSHEKYDFVKFKLDETSLPLIQAENQRAREIYRKHVEESPYFFDWMRLATLEEMDNDESELAK